MLIIENLAPTSDLQVRARPPNDSQCAATIDWGMFETSTNTLPEDCAASGQHGSESLKANRLERERERERVPPRERERVVS